MKTLKQFITPLLIWILILIIGYCFGGKVGIGLGATVILLIQVLL